MTEHINLTDIFDMIDMDLNHTQTTIFIAQHILQKKLTHNLA